VAFDIAGLFGVLAQEVIDTGAALVNSQGVVNVTILSLVDVETGNFAVYRGYDYTAAHGRAASWSSTAWPSLVGASSAKLVIKGTTAPIGTASISSAGGAMQTVSVDLLATDTANLRGNDTYELVAVFGAQSVVLRELIGQVE